jgi:hypothetical protein
VVRDASSGSEHELSTDGSPDSNDPAPQLSTSHLTQELAQLLAASIARQQASRGSAAPTNAGLTSLANLVSAASSQRTLAPVFKDGLSALSYSQPHHKPAEMEDPDPGEPDDEPMPIPSTWRQPTYRDEEKWYRHQMGAALLGLAAGLMIVVPTVLWLSGWFEPQKSKPDATPRVAAAATSDLTAAEVRTMKVQVRPLERPPEAAAQYVTGSIEPRAAPPESSQAPEQSSASALAAKMADAQAAEARARVDDMLAQASRRVENGDVTGAREMLAAAEEGSQGPVAFALAETYDPNMLAAWGSRGVAADVAKAKALYRKALNLGVVNAQNRIDALK